MDALTVDTVNALARRDRLLILGTLAGLVVLSWMYLFWMARMPGCGLRASMSAVSTDGPGAYLWTTFAMWVIMMAAMMIPSATPMMLIFARVNHTRAQTGGSASIPTGMFLTGYLIMWAGFSLLATVLQWVLRAMAMMAPASLTVGPVLGGTLFLIAGVYQWTPLKAACLRRCAAPLDFLFSEWRDGAWGALVMGARYGLFCLGCCVFLMALLFAAGVMNLLWVAALAGVVLLEKLLPPTHWVGRGFGLAFVVVGLWLMNTGTG